MFGSLGLEQVIELLSEGLKLPEQRDRLTKGITWLANNPPEGFNRAVFNVISMPLFTRMAHRQHRFDIPLSDYLYQLSEAIVEVFDPNGPGMVLREGQQRLVYNSTIDQESDYLEMFQKQFVEMVDMILPVH